MGTLVLADTTEWFFPCTTHSCTDLGLFLVCHCNLQTRFWLEVVKNGGAILLIDEPYFYYWLGHCLMPIGKQSQSIWFKCSTNWSLPSALLKIQPHLSSWRTSHFGNSCTTMWDKVAVHLSLPCVRMQPSRFFVVAVQLCPLSCTPISPFDFTSMALCHLMQSMQRLLSFKWQSANCSLIFGDTRDATGSHYDVVTIHYTKCMVPEWVAQYQSQKGIKVFVKSRWH